MSNHGRNDIKSINLRDTKTVITSPSTFKKILGDVSLPYSFFTEHWYQPSSVTLTGLNLKVPVPVILRLGFPLCDVTVTLLCFHVVCGLGKPTDSQGNLTIDPSEAVTFSKSVKNDGAVKREKPNQKFSA